MRRCTLGRIHYYMEFKVMYNMISAIEELDEVLHDPFEGNFKGSKAQRKNAEKRLAAMRRELSAMQAEYVLDLKNKLAEVVEEIESCNRFLTEKLIGFWWELYPLDTRKEMESRISELMTKKKDLENRITRWSK